VLGAQLTALDGGELMFTRICATVLLAGALVTPPPYHANIRLADFLTGSTEALVLGPTGIPTPDSGYLAAADNLYLNPLGFDGTTIALTTPETHDFGPSATQGETDLINTVTSMYNAGDFSATDPLTIMGYSQSSTIESMAEQTLANDGIPSDALRFVMLGDPSSAEGGILNTLGDTTIGKDILDLLGWGNLINDTTPNDLYPTDVYTLNGDHFADYPAMASNALLIHLDYLGLTEAQIQSATSTVDGLTDYFTIPDPSNLLDALLNAFMAVG
jgi:hypothetical protein